MPQNAKFTADQIAEAACTIIKETGLESLTARGLSRYLGTSPTPIFTVFHGMDEVVDAARQLALKEFLAYLGDFSEYPTAFLHIGVKSVLFAGDEPELFRLLFMHQHSQKSSFADTMEELDEFNGFCTELIMREYSLSFDEARLMLEQMWLLAFSLGTLCAMRVCSIGEEEIIRRLSISFDAGLAYLYARRSPQGAPAGDAE